MTGSVNYLSDQLAFKLVDWSEFACAVLDLGAHSEGIELDCLYELSPVLYELSPVPSIKREMKTFLSFLWQEKRIKCRCMNGEVTGVQGQIFVYKQGGECKHHRFHSNGFTGVV